MPKYTPNEENITSENSIKTVYSYCDDKGKPVHKAKELFKKEDKYIYYPYSVNPTDGSVKSKKIHTIELRGWAKESDIPKDFKVVSRYGLRTQRIRQFTQVLYSKFKEVEKLTIGININNRFSTKTISINWSDLLPILKKIGNEKRWYDRTRKLMINNAIAGITTKLAKQKTFLNAGQLDAFLKKFDSFEKVSKADIESLSTVMETAPPSKISVTTNFIKTRDKINKVFIEDIIKNFERLMSAKNDNEKQWQTFFGKNSWILNHLFPFEVILRKQEAYVGGKTLENEDGRVVDFLFANGFQDNFALLEIKTHKKTLLKKSAYRKPDVFAYSDDLSGGISQCLDQKDVFLRDFGSKERIIDPKAILVIGLKSNLTDHQNKCFELLRSNQKNVDILTFDELLAKLKGLLEVIAE
ncbi:Shedu anti-phage system protein SduA domain-containing protein [Psychroserpens sp.]|uniref:Shedu anti-phage system protein SduA domain-containing protein n=1 Tax=Psychroserpens sp. TaxID=2020870 RepID=UPI002B268FE9|nr:Shedu anti-phage system protein SduA domain-containing protein [Psychroserpens sp.]